MYTAAAFASAARGPARRERERIIARPGGNAWLTGGEALACEAHDQVEDQEDRGSEASGAEGCDGEVTGR